MYTSPSESMLAQPPKNFRTGLSAVQRTKYEQEAAKIIIKVLAWALQSFSETVQPNTCNTLVETREIRDSPWDVQDLVDAPLQPTVKGIRNVEANKPRQAQHTPGTRDLQSQV